MVEDAEKFAEADKERKESIEAANKADSVLNDTESTLKEHESKLDKAQVDNIKEKIAALREIVAKSQTGESGTTAADLKAKTDELQVASLDLFEKMHRARAEESKPQEEPKPSEGEKKE